MCVGGGGENLKQRRKSIMKKVKKSVGREGRVFYSGFATKNFEQHFSLFKCSRKKQSGSLDNKV